MHTDDEPLRSARLQRGWSQARAAEELIALAEARGVPVASPVSLKTQLSRWENRHALPEQHYRLLLRELYGRDDADLGLCPPPTSPEAIGDAAQLRTHLATAAALSEDTLELLGAQLRAARELDQRLGAAAVVDSVRAQLSHLETVTSHALDAARRRAAAALLADAAMLAGCHALDLGGPGLAWQHYELAKRAAREAELPGALGVALAEQSGVLLDIGEPDAAVAVTEQALGALGAVPRPARARVLAACGEALAVAGAQREARAAFDRAERELSTAGRFDIQFGVVAAFLDFGPADVRRHRGHAWSVAREDASAVADLEQALADGSGSVRSTAGVHVDLARSLGATGRGEEAARHARAGRDLATRIGSRRLVAALDTALGDARPAAVTS